MGGSASDVLQQASSFASPVLNSSGAGLFNTANAAYNAIKGIQMPKDPFGSKAAQQQQQQAIQDIKDLEVTRDTTRDMSTTQDSVTTTELAPKSAVQKQLESASLQNFLEQQKLVDAQQKSIADRAGLQTAGRDVLSGIASGEAFALSPEEQMRINALRQSEIDVGSQAINEMLNTRLGELQANLAQRGVRGQAASQLQGSALGEAAQSLERRILAANQNAAQQALAMPGQRVGIQANVGTNLSTFMDQAQQQAIANRNMLQDPALLKALRDEQLATATKRTSGTSKQTGTESSVSKGEGAAQAIAQMATQPSVQQSNIAGFGGLMEGLGGLAKGVSGFF